MSNSPARNVAVSALFRARDPKWRWRPVDVDAADLDSRDAQLARAIHATVIQRDRTLEHIVRSLTRRVSDSTMIVLKAALAQLLFMDRVPAYAVIDVAVQQAQSVDRKAAGGMVNAVLRRVEGLVVDRSTTDPWRPMPGAIPLALPCSDSDAGTGPAAPPVGWLKLSRGVPLPANDLTRYLGLVTSHGDDHVAGWREAFGDDQAIELLCHNLRKAPTVVAVEPGFDFASASADHEPHVQEGFIVWRGDHESLVSFLEGHPDRRVQDTTAARAIDSLAGLSPALAVDFCAGRGTKTAQLAARFPDAEIVATDVDANRFGVLQETFADHARVRVVAMDEVERLADQADLVLLDVPCSNSGVLARRIEAKYRWSAHSIGELVGKQRRIIRQALGLVKPGGHLLYSTCSIEAGENERQVQWMRKACRLELIHDDRTMPGGSGCTYRDGGYSALLRLS